MKADRDEPTPLRAEASLLNIAPELEGQRKERRELINKALPGTLLAFIALNAASGGALKGARRRGIGL